MSHSAAPQRRTRQRRHLGACGPCQTKPRAIDSCWPHACPPRKQPKEGTYYISEQSAKSRCLPHDSRAAGEAAMKTGRDRRKNRRRHLNRDRGQGHREKPCELKDAAAQCLDRQSSPLTTNPMAASSHTPERTSRAGRAFRLVARG